MERCPEGFGLNDKSGEIFDRVKYVLLEKKLEKNVQTKPKPNQGVKFFYISVPKSQFQRRLLPETLVLLHLPKVSCRGVRREIQESSDGCTAGCQYRFI